MLRRILVAAGAVASLFALSVPSAPAATFFDDHQPIQEDATETFTGTAEFQHAVLGQVNCHKAEGAIQLLAGQTNGTVTKFQVASPTENCTVSGALGATCGVKSLHQVSLTKHASASVVAGNNITVQGIELLNLFGSTAEPCVELELTSIETKTPKEEDPNETIHHVTLTPDNAETVSSVQLSGQLATDPDFGPVNVAGTLEAHNPGTYGISA